MPVYRIDNKKIVPIERITFAQQGLREHHDLQVLLKSQIDVISPDTLIVAEEFNYRISRFVIKIHTEQRW